MPDSMLGVPLFRNNRIEGVFTLSRARASAFSPRQIELVETFANQAMIAIENARLFEEVRAKTRDLEEALERQTATSEILRVISQSPTDVRPVFDAIVLTAVRVLHCDFAFMIRNYGPEFETVAGASPEGLLAFEQLPSRAAVDPRADFPARAMVEKKKLHVPDWTAVELPEHDRVVGATLGVKSSLYLPLLRANECVGALVLAGTRPDVFAEADIAQAESFADQALIAIENARLFNETQEVPRTADRHRGCAESHQPLGVRSRHDLPDTRDYGGRSLQGLVRIALRAGRRHLPLSRDGRPRVQP